MARHAVDFWLSTEDLPRPENRVTLDRDGNVRISYTPTNEEPEKQLYDELKGLLEHTGDAARPPDPAARLPRRPTSRSRGWRTRPAPAASAPIRRHRCSNVDCRAHELDNLYVVDTSFFPSIGAVNPALTAMANALRVGDHLLERHGRASRIRRRAGVSARRHPRDRRGRRLRGASVCVRQAGAARRRAESRCSTQQLPPVPAAALPGRDVPARGRATSLSRCASSSTSTRMST